MSYDAKLLIYAQFTISFWDKICNFVPVRAIFALAILINV